MKITDEMVERGARALADMHEGWDRLTEGPCMDYMTRAAYRVEARACLTAALDGEQAETPDEKFRETCLLALDEMSRTEPVAYALYDVQRLVHLVVRYEDAARKADEHGYRVVPLYAHPEKPEPSVDTRDRIMQAISEGRRKRQGWWTNAGSTDADVSNAPSDDDFIADAVLTVWPETPEKRLLMTHPSDGHGPDDTCLDCEKAETPEPLEWRSEYRAVFSYPPSILGQTPDTYGRWRDSIAEVAQERPPRPEETHGWRSGIQRRYVTTPEPVETTDHEVGRR